VRLLLHQISFYVMSIIVLLVILTGFFTIVGFMGHLDWRLDLASHFRLAYFVVQFAALLTSVAS
jgi:hypothetical protein